MWSQTGSQRDLCKHVNGGKNQLVAICAFFAPIGYPQVAVSTREGVNLGACWDYQERFLNGSAPFAACGSCAGWIIGQVRVRAEWSRMPPWSRRELPYVTQSTVLMTFSASQAEAGIKPHKCRGYISSAGRKLGQGGRVSPDHARYPQGPAQVL